jgi:hypothetical protein
MDPTMSVAIGWTIVGGFVFTMIVTCLSMVGWVRFADRSQQKRLFTLLIVEVVVGAAAPALGVRYDAIGAGEEQQAAGREVGERYGSDSAFLLVADELLKSDDAQRPPPDKRTLQWLLDQVDPKDETVDAEKLAKLRADVAALPSGKIDPSKAKALRVSIPAPKRPPIRLTPPPPTKTNVSGSK